MIHARDGSIQFDGQVSGADTLRATMGVDNAHIAIEIANSCDGLLCLMRNEDPIGVWNPIGDDEYVPLPEITTTRVYI